MRINRIAKSCIGIAGGAAIMFGASATAHAQYPPQPPGGSGGSRPAISGTAPLCTYDTPYVRYTIDPAGNPVTWPITITLRDSSGTVVGRTQATAPSGTLAYPGATVDSNGNATGWAGWKWSNNQWVRDDASPALHKGLTIEASTDPTASGAVGYVTDTAGCAASRGGVRGVRGSQLPSTGNSVTDVVLIAGATTAAGAAILALAHRRSAAIKA